MGSLAGSATLEEGMWSRRGLVCSNYHKVPSTQLLSHPPTFTPLGFFPLSPDGRGTRQEVKGFCPNQPHIVALPLNARSRACQWTSLSLAFLNHVKGKEEGHLGDVCRWTLDDVWYRVKAQDLGACHTGCYTVETFPLWQVGYYLPAFLFPSAFPINVKIVLSSY